MSLNIDTRRVEAVLVGGHWYGVLPNTFDVDAYEWDIGHYSVQDERQILGWEAVVAYEDATGEYLEHPMSGPVAHLQAVSLKKEVKQ